MTLASDQLKALAFSDPANLAELMRSALRADENLHPRDIPASAQSMLVIALSWQLDAHKSARAAQDSKLPPPPRPPHTRDAAGVPSRAPGPSSEPPTQPQLPNVAPPTNSPILAAPPPQAAGLPASLQEILTGLRAAAGIGGASQPRHVDSDEEDLSRTGKRQRLQLVPQGFTFGSISNIEQLLKHYPGKAISSPALACKELLGPYILVQFLQAGNSIPIFLQDFKHWRQTANGTPSQSELKHLGANHSSRDANARLPTRSASESPIAGGCSPSPLRDPIRRRGGEHGASLRQSLRVAIRTHSSRVSPHGYRDVRPHRRHHDSPNDSGKETYRGPQGRKRSKGDQRIAPSQAPHQHQSWQQASRPSRSSRPSGPSGSPGPTGEAVAGHPDPQPSSSTFPIPLSITVTSEKWHQAAATAIDSLNMRFLGPLLFPYAQLAPIPHPRAPAKRAQTNIYSLLHCMQRSCEPDTTHSAQAALHLASLPSYQLFPELSASLENPALAFQRGSFMPIRPEQIDLPSSRPPPDPNHANFWIRRLPAHVKPLFDEHNSTFHDSLQDYVKSAKRRGTLPPSQVYASQTGYIALLEKAEHAGMLHWSIDSQDDGAASTYVDDIEMTLFFVSKSHTRSRLISWPRVQNEAMPQPPYTSLPNPAMFEAIRNTGKSMGSFFLDISNMFHNITLPLWLARLLPMKRVAFEDLPRRKTASHR